MLKYFIVETKDRITNEDHFKLRTLYSPVIGKDAIFIYETLIDFYTIKQKNNLYSNTSDLVAILLMTLPNILEELKKLEAVGLVRTFIDSSENTSVYSLIRPLDIIRFRKNAFLFNQFIKKVGIEFFEKIAKSLEEPQIIKDELLEVTAKFQDVYSIDMMIEEKHDNFSNNTIEIPLGLQVSKDDAHSKLTPAQYILFLTKVKVTSNQLNTINAIQAFGFDAKAINVLIDYSFDKNDGKIVANYIHKIARDLYKRGITIDTQIKKEFQSLKNKHKTIDMFSLKKADIIRDDKNISESKKENNQETNYEELGIEDLEW